MHFYGGDFRRSAAYPRIISDRAFTRLQSYIDTAERIVWGGEYDASERFIAPTLIDSPDPGSPLMQEEIFGPILPVMNFDDTESAADFINAREKPLALYYFGRKADGLRLIGRTASGRRLHQRYDNTSPIPVCPSAARETAGWEGTTDAFRSTPSPTCGPWPSPDAAPTCRSAIRPTAGVSAC